MLPAAPTSCDRRFHLPSKLPQMSPSSDSSMLHLARPSTRNRVRNDKEFFITLIMLLKLVYELKHYSYFYQIHCWAIRSFSLQMPILWSQEPVTTTSSPTKTGLVTLSSCRTRFACILGLPSQLQFHSLTEPSFPLETRYFLFGCRLTLRHDVPTWARNSVSFLSLPPANSYQTISPYQDEQKILPGRVFQLAQMPYILMCWPTSSRAVSKTVSVFESMAVVWPPRVVTNRQSPLFDHEISNPTNDFKSSLLIGSLALATSQMRSSPPSPTEAINLSSSLTLAQQTLSLWPSSFWQAEAFFRSQSCTVLSGLAETKNLPSWAKSNDHTPSLIYTPITCGQQMPRSR